MKPFLIVADRSQQPNAVKDKEIVGETDTLGEATEIAKKHTRTDQPAEIFMRVKTSTVELVVKDTAPDTKPVVVEVNPIIEEPAPIEKPGEEDVVVVNP